MALGACGRAAGYGLRQGTPLAVARCGTVSCTRCGPDGKVRVFSRSRRGSSRLSGRRGAGARGARARLRRPHDLGRRSRRARVGAHRRAAAGRDAPPAGGRRGDRRLARVLRSRRPAARRSRSSGPAQSARDPLRRRVRAAVGARQPRRRAPARRPRRGARPPLGPARTAAKRGSLAWLSATGCVDPAPSATRGCGWCGGSRPGAIVLAVENGAAYFGDGEAIRRLAPARRAPGASRGCPGTVVALTTARRRRPAVGTRVKRVPIRP